MKLGKRGKTAALLALLLFAGALWAWNSWPGLKATALPADTVVFANYADPATIDPSKAWTLDELQVVVNLFEGLVRLGPDGRGMPGVATHWTVSPDGLTVTFFLRPEARWSDGKPVTAEHFVYAFRRLLSPQTLSRFAENWSAIRNAPEVMAGKQAPETLDVTAPTPHTLVLTLRRPLPWLIDMAWTVMPLREDGIAAHGDSWARPGNMISNGAYRLKAWEKQARIICEKNPYYWGQERVSIPRVSFLACPSRESAVALFEAGQLDLTTHVPPGVLKRYIARGDKRARRGTFFSLWGLLLSAQAPPLKGNVKLRQALALAIDTDRIQQTVLQGMDDAVTGLVPAGLRAVPKEEKRSYALRLAEAQRLYKEAGYGPEKPLTLTLTYNQDDTNRQVMTAIATLWKEGLGVSCIFEAEEWKTFLKHIQDPRTYQVARKALVWGAPHPAWVMEGFRSGDSRNFPGLEDPLFDALLEKVWVADKAASLTATAALEARLMSQAVWVPVFEYAARVLTSPRLQVAINPLGIYLFQDAHFQR